MRTSAPGVGRRVPVLATTAVAALLATVGLGGCGGPAQAGDGAQRTIVLTVRYSRFTPSEVRVRPGTTVRFVVENLDPIAHELIIGDGAVHERHEKGTDAHHGTVPGEVSVAAGSTAETVFTFPNLPGAVLFGCHLPGHWDFGMKGVATVA